MIVVLIFLLYFIFQGNENICLTEWGGVGVAQLGMIGGAGLSIVDLFLHPDCLKDNWGY